MSFRRLILPGCAAGLLCLVSSAWAQEIRAAAALERVDNLSRSSSPADRRDAWVGRIEASASRRRQLTPGWGLTGEATAGAVASPDYRDLRTWRGGGSLRLQRKFGLGPYAPVFQVGGAAHGLESGIPGADRVEVRADVRLSRRFSDRWSAQTTLAWDEALAEGRTFDTGAASVELEMHHDLDERWRITAGAGWLSGTFTANASATVWQRALDGLAGARVASYYRTVPRHLTETYGPGWVTYRVRGDVRRWWVALSPALSERTSLTLRYESAEAENRADVTYRQHAWTLGWAHVW